MKKVKPCPHCGGTSIEYMTYAKYANMYRDEYDGYHDEDSDEEGGMVICSAAEGKGCGATSGYGYNKELAYEKWNTRIPIYSLKDIYE